MTESENACVGSEIADKSADKNQIDIGIETANSKQNLKRSILL